MRNNSSDFNIFGGLLGVVGVVLVILKLAGVIAWSWWLVTLPFYFGLLVAGAVLLIMGIGWILAIFGAFVIGLIVSIFDWGKEK